MSVGTYGSCQVKGGLFKCGTAANAMCVYCGRPFCERHGVIGADGEEVCDSKNCVAKREDLAVHLEYKEAVLGLNRERLCGIGECGAEFTWQCNRCRLYFCQSHLETREMPVMEEGMRFERPVLVCRHCWQRRSIWEKT
ncbi:MAG TPA: hypothetical protein VG845_10535 [Dehalococcoidia bacterium]|jgi:hypothetical protein|nr:hypothetical protein [Dehalococcoidia bacterium]